MTDRWPAILGDVLDASYDRDDTIRVFRAANGTASAPSYTFGSDPDTGMYRYGANAVGFATNGSLSFLVRTMDVIAYKPLLAQPGSAAAPSHSFQIDPDTGMYRYGANAVGFAANGSLSFLVRTMDVIAYKPLLAQPGSAAAPSHSFQIDPDTGMYRYGANVLGFAAHGIGHSFVHPHGTSFVGDGVGAPYTGTTCALHVTASAAQAAAAFYKKINTSNSSVLHVRSDVGGTDSLVWYVDSDGDAIKVSDPKLKSSIKPARSYWDDWKRLGKSGALIQHGWKRAPDKARLTNWDASKVKKVFPKLAPIFEDEDTGKKRLMVNYSALDLIAHRVLMEAVERIEALESKAGVANGK